MPQENFPQKPCLFKETTIKIIAGAFVIILFSFVCLALGLKPVEIIPVKISSIISSTPFISTDNNIADDLASQSQIKKFKDYDELEEFLKNNASEGVGRGDLDVITESVSLGSPTDAMAKTGFQAMEATNGSSGSDDYSKTNIQVEGVDEADIIKTDGKYVYAVSGRDLFIIDAYPAEGSQIISKITFDSRPQDIYLNNNNLVVYGRNNTIYERDFYKNFKRRSQYTFLKVFDIEDKKNPKQIRDLDFEGNFVSSRMIGDYIYFITSERAYYLDGEMPVPRILDGGRVINSEKMTNVYYVDIPYGSYNYTHIVAVNVKNPQKEITSEAYLLGYGRNIYVSQNNIYFTYTKYISEFRLMMEVVREFLFPRLSQTDQTKISEIEAISNSILSQEEKMAKIGQIIQGYIYSLTDAKQDALEEEMTQKIKEKYEDLSKELEKTVIHKIAIDKDKIKYKTFGEVTGQVLNQFSMDEQNGFFRIATTKNRTWSKFTDERIDSYNNLYVLDKNLKIVGKVEDLAKGERIYSVRFMQNRAYMVTFKQIDPLFVIDLKDPRNPKVLGELKVPGFSNYLHPYNDNILIGFGKETGENEWGGVKTGGLKLSLFDVSDVNNLREIDKYELGDQGSDSYALRDHKAFLFSQEKNLLVVPTTLRESKDNNRWGEITFKGAVVFEVDESGFKLKGKIRHGENSFIPGSGSPEPLIDRPGMKIYPPINSESQVKRSLYIDNVLYTFSDQYLMMNKLKDLEEVKSLDFSKFKGGDDFRIIN